MITCETYIRVDASSMLESEQRNQDVLERFVEPTTLTVRPSIEFGDPGPMPETEGLLLLAAVKGGG